MQRDYCDLDLPQCPDFHNATYCELEWYGDLMREMAEPIDWISYFTDGAFVSEGERDAGA
jgi:hypothetical protein